MATYFKIVMFAVLGFVQLCTGQNLIKGGLQGHETLILTADGIEKNTWQNSKTAGITITGNNHADFEFAPSLKNGQNWVAVFNLPLKNNPANVFFYDSWVGTSHNIKTNGRKRSFPNDITSKISSNAYHIAFQREFMVENETFMLLVSPKKQEVVVELPAEIFKTYRRLIYAMEAWEAKFVHIVIPPEDASVVMWQREPKRRTISLNKNWEFVYVQNVQDPIFENSPFLKKDVQVQQVNIPHIFNYASHFDFKNYKDTLNVNPMYARGTGWYKKTFTAPKDWKDYYVRLNFLAANQRADVWLNGQFLGTHIGGFTGFHFGVDKLIKYDVQNELLVRVDNRFHPDYLPHTADFDSQGGIYREVELQVLNPTFVKSTWVKATNISALSADLEIETVINNTKNTEEAVEIVTSIINPYNEIIASAVKNLQVPSKTKQTEITRFMQLKNPMLWFPDSPFLYQVLVTLKNTKGEVIDQHLENFGIRHFQFDKDTGFALNGVPMKLHGVNVHQDAYMKGWAVDSLSRKKDYLLMKEMGVNFIRMSHYPHHPHALHLADSLGMMVWEEIPVVNSVGKENFIKNALKTTEEMILRDRNHPSVIMWGVGNEYYRDYFTDDMVEWALRCTEATSALAKKLDPYRPTVQAQNDLVDERIMKLTDLQGRNRYFGWYTGGSAYMGFTGYDGFEKAMEIERKKYPEWKVIISEYGAEGKYGYHLNNPQRFDHSETYQLNFHKAYWNYIEKTDWISGSALWNMFDFTSFAKIGNIPHINQKGMMTYDRKPKSLYFYYQSKWTEELMVYINSHTWLHRFGNPKEKQAVEVFSNGDEVELFVNGISEGKKIKSSEWIWQVALKEGYNILKAVATKNGKVEEATLRIYFGDGTESIKKTSGKDSD